MKFPVLSVATAVSCCVWMTQAVPAWDMYSSRQAIGELVPGTTIIHAYGPASSNNGEMHFMRSIKAPGLETNLTIAPWQHEHGPPSRFFVSQGQLYQITNQSHILYADLVNATLEMHERDSRGQAPKMAFKLRLAEKKSKDSVMGIWEWVATMLQFRMGSKTNHGLFYKCWELDGGFGVYVPLEAGRTPDGCDILTLVSHTIQAHKS